MKKNLIKKAVRIKIIMCDVDGVLTDGLIYLGDNSQELKAFHVRDGKGIVLAQKSGIKFALITGRSSELVARRAKELGIEDVFQNISKKLPVFKDLLKKYNLQSEEAAYIGDDINDYQVLKEAGLAFTVADGVQEVREIADYITDKKGGQGAVREIIELILKARGVDRLVKI